MWTRSSIGNQNIYTPVLCGSLLKKERLITSISSLKPVQQSSLMSFSQKGAYVDSQHGRGPSYRKQFVGSDWL